MNDQHDAHMSPENGGAGNPAHAATAAGRTVNAAHDVPPVATYRRDLLTNRYEALSQEFEQITGHAVEVILALPLTAVLDLLHPGDADRIMNVMMELDSCAPGTSMAVEYRMRRPDGQYVWLQDAFHIVHDASGTPTTLVGSITDVTKRRMAEESHHRSERFLDAVIELSPVSLWIADRSGVMLRMNQACRDFLGIRDEDAIGRYSILDDPRLQELGHVTLVRRVFEHGESVRFQAQIDMAGLPDHSRTGTRHIDISISPVLDDDGTVTNAIVQHIDITERVTMMEELQRTNAALTEVNAEKDRFFAIIAHDLRSPFNSFLGYTEMMVDELPKMTLDQIQRMAQNMRRTASTLNQLLENLLEWSRINQGVVSFSPCQQALCALVQECLHFCEPVAERKGVCIRNAVPVDVMVFGDAAQVSSIVRNLVGNAVKFSPRGTEVWITARQDEGGIRLDVTDQGIGMDAGIMSRLFRIDDRVTRRGTDGEPGSGIGLLICRELARRHGGEITVESSPGRGSTFHVHLPGGG